MPHTMSVTTPGDREVAMVRAFDAPRDLVFDAFAKPELVKRWMAVDAWPMRDCEIDFRPGGSFRWIWQHADGREMAVSGGYVEIDRPTRIVHTEIFDEDWTGGQTTVTTTFEESGGVTTVTMTTLYVSREARDAALATPMDEGVAECFDKLEAMLADNASAA